MSDLLDQLQQLYNASENWNYYNLANITNPFNSPTNNNSKKFIKEYLEYSEKTKDIYDVLELIEPKRNLHIVLDFLLGILIYENNIKIKTAIDNQIKKLTPPENISFDNSFKYFWFLTCFYHDVGYYYENNRTVIKSLSTLEHDLKIENRLTQLIGVPKLAHHTKNNYLNYRLREWKVYDHGIIGGMLVYDRLIKIFQYNQEFHGDQKKSFMYKNLYWSESMIKYFQLIASVVLTHNIWFINKNVDSKTKIKLYQKYKLDKLILSDSTRIISLKRHPLLFLLCLVDSIEPTKNYGVGFLKKIRMVFPSRDTITVQGHINDNEVQKWLRSINSLNNWLKIQLNVNHNSDLGIKL